ncbi:iron dicitrate transport regulator FecR [Comamonas serinivorans]|uniref:Iron dicitrate transport regulator FecR n=1 Tax=Comamonas serinivorans TaxID=1082851 RepID=A0A1Y0ESD6_9BURK|nr:FecR domain-containing protein [Comamonas serinivorans]ARU06523.1 iron dicitrate transport regulator FecR [Comamonas serinivorans]
MSPTPTAAEAALDWLVTLNSGAVSEAERRHFDAWLAEPAHRAAWERLAGPLQQALAPARAAAARAPQASLALSQALVHAESRTRERRRLLRGALALGALGLGSAWLLADRHLPLAQLSADLRTGTGERRTFTLTDGSTVQLAARSAADLAFGPGQRTLTLRQGALLAQAEPAAAHGGAPFIVRTPHGQVRALGTRFVVQLNEADSYVGMLQHRSEVTTRDGQRLQLDEGQGARFGAQGVAADARPPAAASAWAQGLLQAHDQALGEVVEALRAWRAGFIRISPRAAALRVYGSYALADTDRALAALAETLPITVRVYRAGWLVVID